MRCVSTCAWLGYLADGQELSAGEITVERLVYCNTYNIGRILSHPVFFNTLLRNKNIVVTQSVMYKWLYMSLIYFKSSLEPIQVFCRLLNIFQIMVLDHLANHIYISDWSPKWKYRERCICIASTFPHVTFTTFTSIMLSTANSFLCLHSYIYICHV